MGDKLLQDLSLDLFPVIVSQNWQLGVKDIKEPCHGIWGRGVWACCLLFFFQYMKRSHWSQLLALEFSHSCPSPQRHVPIPQFLFTVPFCVCHWFQHGNTSIHTEHSQWLQYFPRTATIYNDLAWHLWPACYFFPPYHVLWQLGMSVESKNSGVRELEFKSCHHICLISSL